ncbi:Putative ribonuclease H protein [Arachis hypogaea]|nr:Putative ribonuclease H protein [Arachis hypogaea]
MFPKSSMTCSSVLEEKAVAAKLISLQRRFLWSKEDGSQGMALVKWELVQAPRKFGGLGVGDAMVRNTALLFKWWWRFAKEECPLWKKVVCSCNNLRPNELLYTQVLPTRGGPWKDICHLQVQEQSLRDKLITGLAMEVGDGRRTRFWEDGWLHCGSLKDRFPRLFSVSNQCGSVIGDCGFWDGLKWIWNFQWRRELFQWELDLLSQLHEVLRPVRLANNREDRVVWKYDRLGIFSTNSFVQVLQEGMLSEDVTSYSFTKTIWKGLVPPRVELFVWFVLVGRVNTKERLSRIGIISQDDKNCVLCNKDVEQVHHLFLGCEFAWQVWSAWISVFGRYWTVPELVKDHFLSWTDEPRRQDDRKQRLRSFCAIVWHIWMERNRRIFQNEGKGVQDIITMTFLSCDEWRGVYP